MKHRHWSAFYLFFAVIGLFAIVISTENYFVDFCLSIICIMFVWLGYKHFLAAEQKGEFD